MLAIWEMVKEAVAEIDREVSYSELKSWVREKYGEQNESSLTCAIISGSVNHPSRIHYGENKKTRIATGKHDYLFNTGRGRVTPYNPKEHGVWEIYQKDDGQFRVRLSEDESAELDIENNSTEACSELFALESHLRDYLAKNIGSLNRDNSKLSLYSSEDGRDGIEFQTDVGPMDLLARDEKGNFVVIELKLGRSPDATLGQILRYMGWVEKHLAKGKEVRGIIVGGEIPKKLRYAVTQVPQVTLMEYQLSFSVSAVELES